MEIEVVCLIPACPPLYIIHSTDSNFRIKAATIFARTVEPEPHFFFLTDVIAGTFLLGSKNVGRAV